MSRALRIVVLAPLRYPISVPHAGGLESAIWNEVRELRRRGHHVTLAAPEGSDFLEQSPPEFILPAVAWGDSPHLNDVGHPAGYLEVALPALHRALDYISRNSEQFDLIMNHSLQPAPLARAAELGVPVVSTLHTPVLRDLVSANIELERGGSRFIAVSEHTAGEWRRAGIPSVVLSNGIEPDDWPLGQGGDGLVWFGRIVPEKAPHLAIEAAQRLGRPLAIVGRVGDRAYAEREVFSRLGPDVSYLGPLGVPELAAVVGRSACTLVTPVWHEPFGLVIPESLSCGTPVAAFDAGGIGETAARTSGVATVPIGDAAALADAAELAIAEVASGAVTRAEIRASAVAAFSYAHRTGRLESLLRDILSETAITGAGEQVA